MVEVGLYLDFPDELSEEILFDDSFLFNNFQRDHEPCEFFHSQEYAGKLSLPQLFNNLKAVNRELIVFRVKTGENIFGFERNWVWKFSLLLGSSFQKCRNGFLRSRSCYHVLCRAGWGCLLQVFDSLLLKYRTLEILRAVLTGDYATFPLYLCRNKTWNPFYWGVVAFPRWEITQFLVNQILLAFRGSIRILRHDLISSIRLQIILWWISCQKSGFENIILVFILGFCLVWVTRGLIRSSPNSDVVWCGSGSLHVKPFRRRSMHEFILLKN